MSLLLRTDTIHYNWGIGRDYISSFQLDKTTEIQYRKEENFYTNQAIYIVRLYFDEYKFFQIHNRVARGNHHSIMLNL